MQYPYLTVTEIYMKISFKGELKARLTGFTLAVSQSAAILPENSARNLHLGVHLFQVKTELCSPHTKPVN